MADFLREKLKEAKHDDNAGDDADTRDDMDNSDEEEEKEEISNILCSFCI